MFSAIRILPGLFFGSFVPWYFYGQPKRILQNYIAYASACMEILSIPFLILTLFSPWKSIVDEYPRNLMAFGEIAQVFTLNCTTRIVGFVFRSIALVLAFVLQIGFLAGFLSYLLLWLCYPGIVVAGILFLLQN